MKTVFDAAFAQYGKVIEGYDLTQLTAAMQNTELPEGVTYVGSVPELEATDYAKEAAARFYGGMPIQVGFCNGHNDTLNALEYHRGTEINVAITPAILMVGRLQDVEADFTYDTAKVEAFLVPAGTAVSVYETTLHYAPCSVDGQGFRVTIVLPKGTNVDMDAPLTTGGEDRLLFAVNKWLIAHEDAKIEGAFNGLKGKNLTLADFE